MKQFLKATIAILLCGLQVYVSQTAAAAERLAPFRIPPSGKAELLIGGIKLEAPTAMAFDSKNRPYLINNRKPESFGLIRTIRGGKWVTLSCLEAIRPARRPAERNMHAQGEVVIDDGDCLYATIAGRLVYSSDLGENFRAYRCRGTLEVRVGHNKLAAPPAISQTTNHKKVSGVRWGGAARCR